MKIFFLPCKSIMVLMFYYRTLKNNFQSIVQTRLECCYLT